MLEINKELLNNWRVNKEINERKYLKLIYNKNIKCQKWWNAAKAELRGNFMALSAVIEKER